MSPKLNDRGGGSRMSRRGAGGAYNSSINNAAWQPNNKDLDFDIGPIPPSNRSNNSSRMQKQDGDGSIRGSYKKTNHQNQVDKDTMFQLWGSYQPEQLYLDPYTAQAARMSITTKVQNQNRASSSIIEAETPLTPPPDRYSAMRPI